MPNMTCILKTFNRLGLTWSISENVNQPHKLAKKNPELFAKKKKSLNTQASLWTVNCEKNMKAASFSCKNGFWDAILNFTRLVSCYNLHMRSCYSDMIHSTYLLQSLFEHIHVQEPQEPQSPALTKSHTVEHMGHQSWLDWQTISSAGVWGWGYQTA